MMEAVDNGSLVTVAKWRGRLQGGKNNEKVMKKPLGFEARGPRHAEVWCARFFTGLAFRLDQG